MKKGFTLAEVLITLAIIGVVAALTIPVVVHKYQQKALYTQFIKVYNTLNSAMNLSFAENGLPRTWTYDSKKQEEAIRKYVFPYFKIAQECPKENASVCLNYYVTNLHGSFSIPASQVFYETTGDSNYVNNSPVIILADGSLISVRSGGGGYSQVRGLEFYFDTNGAKGPNTIGRDIFKIEYSPQEIPIPNTSDKREGNYKWGNEYIQGGTPDGSNSGKLLESNCDPSSTDTYNGVGCSGRLLIEGKMNY